MSRPRKPVRSPRAGPATTRERGSTCGGCRAARAGPDGEPRRPPVCRSQDAALSSSRYPPSRLLIIPIIPHLPASGNDCRSARGSTAGAARLVGRYEIASRPLCRPSERNGQDIQARLYSRGELRFAARSCAAPLQIPQATIRLDMAPASSASASYRSSPMPGRP
jgi:hypothetical protein